MPITNETQLLDARKRSIRCGFQTGGLSLSSASLYHQLWAQMLFPSAGAHPTTAAVCTMATPGAVLQFPANGQTYINRADLKSLTANTILFSDRLAHMGGLNATLTTAQTVNISLPADASRCAADGSDVMWYLTAFAQLGSTGVTATVTYTNQADVSGRTTTVAVPATMRTQSGVPVLPDVSDSAIKSIQSVQLSATTGTAGNFGFVARKTYLRGGAAAGYAFKDQRDVLIPIPDDICGEISIIAGNASAVSVSGEFILVQG